MWTPSRGLGSGRRAGLRRIADYIGDDHTDASDNESFITSHSDELLASTSAAGGMLPAFLADQSDLVEVMLELDEESMVVRSVTPTAGPSASAGAGTHTPGSGRNLSRSSSTSSKIRRTFAWLRSPAAAPEQPREAAMASRERRRVQARLDRSLSGARRALKGLRFISRATGSTEATALWGAVEERFDALSRDGLLARDDFGDCIGMVDSKEFAVGIFDALARRRRQNLQRVTKEELRDFWLQISDQSFDARLQIFFDMVDTNVDGRITREEVQELIVLSASANKLSKLKEQAEEYALLIMEELDPEGLGYIEVPHPYKHSTSSGTWAHAAVAAGGAAPAARRLHELQPAAQQRQRQRSAVEPGHRRRRRAGEAGDDGGARTGQVAAVEPAARGGEGARGGGGELAARVGARAVGRGDGGAVRVEVRAVPAVGGVRGDGVLPADGQGRRRDAEAQHGARAPPRLPHHAHAAPLLLGALPRALGRLHRLPQGDSHGDRGGDLPARGEPSGVRLPAADRVEPGGVPAAGRLLRGGEADVQEPAVRRGGRDRGGDGGADGRVLHPGGPAAAEGAHPDPAALPAGPPRRVQRLLVLPPPARRRLPPAARARLVHLPRHQVVPEDDMDVHSRTVRPSRR
uniref:EF-hand domain-containing protein n=2 Tax=Aegilops tauschii subsp. strangulata TaxID=200361 RepID=A0A453NPU1_AEGTS